MVVEVVNPQNSSMHYGDKPAVRVINAPDQLPKRVLYTNAEADKIYHEIQYDIYDKARHTKRPPKGKFPTVLKILGGIIAVGAAIVFRKNIASFCKKIFKNPFKK
ncbi:hypothetical protein IJ541_02445 [bacterium]|nr:hypothetical protein [bacterium]